MFQVQPSVTATRELRAAALAMKAMPPKLRSDINKFTRQTMAGPWKELVESKQLTTQDKKIYAGARIKAGNPPTATAANSKRKLSGGLVPSENWKGFEFGTDDREQTITYTRKNRRNAGTHRVTRRGYRQLPSRNPRGRVVYPAFAELAPRMVSGWVQIIVRKTYEQFENR